MKNYIVYKIYYGNTVAYVGKTDRTIQERTREHLFEKPLSRIFDINFVTKVEYHNFDSEADMNFYELYYINLLKPPLNSFAKLKDKITFTLPEITWISAEFRDWDKWKYELLHMNNSYLSFDKNLKILNDKKKVLLSIQNKIDNETFWKTYASLLQKEKSILRKYTIVIDNKTFAPLPFPLMFMKDDYVCYRIGKNLFSIGKVVNGCLTLSNNHVLFQKLYTYNSKTKKFVKVNDKYNYDAQRCSALLKLDYLYYQKQ